MTLVLQVDPTNPQPELIAQAAAVIRAGGLVAFPTETVYGLGADGLSAPAVARIFAAKRRPANDPLILHLASADQLALVTPEVPPLAQRLAQAYWPGPLTLILRRAAQVPAGIAADGPTVAVRVPAHAVAQALIRAAGTPIAAPSANLFSKPSPTRATDVLEDLNGRIDMLLDGGATQIGIESTVLDLTTAQPTLLRPGGLPLEQIEALIGPVLLPGEAGEREHAVVPEGQAATAPGMLLKHYAPRARLLYAVGTTASPDRGKAALRTIAEETLARGSRLGLLLCDEHMAALDDLAAERVSLGSCADLASIAARLFSSMRALDRTGINAILTHDYDNSGLGRALNDRLYRAAEGKTIKV